MNAAEAHQQELERRQQEENRMLREEITAKHWERAREAQAELDQLRKEMEK